MQKIVKILSAAICAGLISIGFATAAVVDKTLAIVNGEAIMSSQFYKLVNPAVEQYKQMAGPQATDEKLKQLKEKALEQMVVDTLLKQEANKKKLKVTSREIEQGIKQVKARFETEAEFQSELKKEGITSSDFEKRIADQLKVMKLIEAEIKGKVVPPTDEEAKSLFEQIQQSIQGKALGLPKDEEDEIAQLAEAFKSSTMEAVRARHILLMVDKKATMAEKTAVLNKIKKIQKEIKGGADFGEAATKYSEDPGSKTRGGDLGFFTKGRMVPEFDKAAFSLNVGQVSEPVLTEFGYHLIKVEEKRAERKLSFEDVSNDLKQIIGQRKTAAKYESWLSELKAKSNIKINSLE